MRTSINDHKVGSFSDISLEQIIFSHGRIYALLQIFNLRLEVITGFIPDTFISATAIQIRKTWIFNVNPPLLSWALVNNDNRILKFQ